MKMPLDFSTPQESYKVHAYDKRGNIAVVELDSDFSKKPFRVLLEFGYDTDYDWSSMLYCESIKDAFKLYDELLSNIFIEANGLVKVKENIQYRKEGTQ